MSGKLSKHAGITHTGDRPQHIHGSSNRTADVSGYGRDVIQIVNSSIVGSKPEQQSQEISVDNADNFFTRLAGKLLERVGQKYFELSLPIFWGVVQLSQLVTEFWNSLKALYSKAF